VCYHAIPRRYIPIETACRATRFRCVVASRQVKQARVGKRRRLSQAAEDGSRSARGGEREGEAAGEKSVAKCRRRALPP